MCKSPAADSPVAPSSWAPLAAVSSKNFATVVTPVALHTIARIALYQRDAFTGNLLIDIEIRDLTTNNPVDVDFDFIELERS